MDKIYFHVKIENAEIDDFSSLLNDEELFCSLDNCEITGSEEELDKKFEESGFMRKR